MKFILTFFILYFSTSFYAQKIEIIQGIHVNKFFETDNGSRFQNNYTSYTGYTIRLAYQSPKVRKMSWRLELGYQKYHTDFRSQDGGIGGGYYVQARIDKSVISFTVFPLNLTFWDKLNINLGLTFSGAVTSSYEGVRTYYSNIPPSSTSEDLHDIYMNYISFGHLGLSGRLAYNFKLSSKVTLSPQYSYYYGVTSEFQAFPRNAKTMRHYYCVGVGMEI
jgi:hypothetical protein